MRITPELLKELDFKEIGHNKYELRQIELFYLEKDRDCEHTWTFWLPETPPHSVTDIEELFHFAFMEGFECGKDEAREEMREALGIRSNE